MAHVVRAWRASRTIRFFVLIILLGSATEAVLSRGTAPAQPEVRQTQRFGSERLVSIEPFSETDGELCVTEPQLIASLSPEMRILRRQQSGSEATAASSLAPPRPSDAVRADVAKRQPITTLRDPRNAFAGLAIDPTRTLCE